MWEMQAVPHSSSFEIQEQKNIRQNFIIIFAIATAQKSWGEKSHI